MRTLVSTGPAAKVERFTLCGIETIWRENKIPAHVSLGHQLIMKLYEQAL